MLEDKSIDKPKFWNFLTGLKRKMGDKPWVLYLDNLRVHTSQETVAFMD